MRHGFKVGIEQRVIERTESPDSWYIKCGNIFNGVGIVDQIDEFDLPDLVADIELTDKMYLVWVEFSTGDSFGSGIKNEFEVLGIFNKQEHADELADFIAATEYKEGGRNHYIDGLEYPGYEFFEQQYIEELDFNMDVGVFNSSSGQKIQFFYFPWAGYFERLDYIHIEELSFPN